MRVFSLGVGAIGFYFDMLHEETRRTETHSQIGRLRNGRFVFTSQGRGSRGKMSLVPPHGRCQAHNGRGTGTESRPGMWTGLEACGVAPTPWEASGAESPEPIPRVGPVRHPGESVPLVAWAGDEPELVPPERNGRESHFRLDGRAYL